MSLEHIDFQPYLAAIASTYEKWWTLYTLTDAEGRQPKSKDAPSIFDFCLMVGVIPHSRIRDMRVNSIKAIERSGDKR